MIAIVSEVVEMIQFWRLIKVLLLEVIQEDLISKRVREINSSII